MDKKNDNTDYKYETPPLELIITTHELVDEEWIASVKHTFYGYTQKELFALVEAHKQTDSFFKSSFEGKFKWKGETIRLKNSEVKVAWP